MPVTFTFPHLSAMILISELKVPPGKLTNSILPLLIPETHIYFERNDVFYDSIILSQSGLTFGAYGTGSNPVITGFTNVINWTNLEGNIWESTNSVSSLGSVNVVTINGVNVPMGRYPDSGYLTYQTFVDTSSITVIV
jgi:hypothetical protein